MSSFSIIKDFKVKTNKAFLEKAAALEPVLNVQAVAPKRIVTVKADNSGKAAVHNIDDISALSEKSFKKGERLILDFGEHLVGSVAFNIETEGSHYDAPAYIKFKFAETPAELLENSDEYNGWLSKSWIQEDTYHFDILPQKIRLPRRYAFRYMQIEILDTSPKYSLRFENMVCESVTSAQKIPEPLCSPDELLNKIDKVSIKTLTECMQKVFEDGVKRDRRLWLGDLRLQALADYASCKNYDLVKRCLYFFAGMTFEDGRMAACFFHEPEPKADDTYLMDFALLFNPALFDYYEETKDNEVLKDLYPYAMDQIDICLDTMLDENNVVIDHGDDFWCFLDWGNGLNKQAGAQAVLIYSMNYGVKLAKIMGDNERADMLEKKIEILKQAALKAFWDKERRLFVSAGQTSWVSQVWMVLAGVTDKETGRDLLLRAKDSGLDVKMVTPYAYHYYIDALISVGEDDYALEEIKRYWGGMVEDGADTFWEVYNPDNKDESPYGSEMVNSFCHAWSCTPTYFLRKH